MLWVQLGRQRVGRNPALRRAVVGGDSGSVGGILFTCNSLLVYQIYSPVATQTWDNPPLSPPPHHIVSVPVTPDSEGAPAPGAPGQGVSTYGIWPGRGSPPEVCLQRGVAPPRCPKQPKLKTETNWCFALLRCHACSLQFADSKLVNRESRDTDR